MDKKTNELYNAVLDYLDIQASCVLVDGLSICTTAYDVLREPYMKEFNIKLRYIDKEEYKAYREEKRTTK